jgi:hypothetical protein
LSTYHSAPYCFTAHEERTSTGKLHSAHISEIEIINEKSRDSSRSLSGDNRGGTAQPAYDNSLVEFLGSVKRKVSRIVGENGEPLPVFAYGDRAKAQNVIIEIQHDNKNFLVGIHFDQKYRGVKISDIRTLFPKDNHEWLNWINKGLLLYADIEKLQAVVAQQRMNSAEVSQPQLGAESSSRGNPTAEQFADVSRLDLEPIERLIREHAGVKDYFPAEGDIYFQAAFHGNSHRFNRFDRVSVSDAMHRLSDIAGGARSA